MSVTAAQITRVRGMTFEPAGSSSYTDDAVTTFIENHPLPDYSGEDPIDIDTGDTNTNWTPTYDLNAAAADIWDEKAAAASEKFDVSADGATLHRSQVPDFAVRRARYFRSRASASSFNHVISPDPKLSQTLDLDNTWSNDDLN